MQRGCRSVCDSHHFFLVPKLSSAQQPVLGLNGPSNQHGVALLNPSPLLPPSADRQQVPLKEAEVRLLDASELATCRAVFTCIFVFMTDRRPQAPMLLGSFVTTLNTWPGVGCSSMTATCSQFHGSAERKQSYSAAYGAAASRVRMHQNAEFNCVHARHTCTVWKFFQLGRRWHVVGAHGTLLQAGRGGSGQSDLGHAREAAVSKQGSGVHAGRMERCGMFPALQARRGARRLQQAAPPSAAAALGGQEASCRGGCHLRALRHERRQLALLLAGILLAGPAAPEGPEQPEPLLLLLCTARTASGTAAQEALARSLAARRGGRAGAGLSAMGQVSVFVRSAGVAEGRGSLRIGYDMSMGQDMSIG